MSATDDLPMCPVCFAILDDDGTCPESADHDPDLLGLWSERNESA